MHRPVLLKEVARALVVRRGGVYVDGTVGGGGHARAILEAAGPDARLIALDRDAEALARARNALADLAGRCRFVQANFADLGRVAAESGVARVDGVLLDVGISSDQLDDPERGFSLMRDGPLDMRMDRSTGPTAAGLLASLGREELERILREYGEEPLATRVAWAISEAQAREPIRTTGQLARLVERVKGRGRGRIHPATQTFQALRIEVNGELKALEAALPRALEWLEIGGRLAVIAFHSLEDRMVKRFMRDHEGRWENLAAGGREWVGALPPVRRVTRKPATASEEELGGNPRARSARLRAAERSG